MMEYPPSSAAAYDEVLYIDDRYKPYGTVTVHRASPSHANAASQQAPVCLLPPPAVEYLAAPQMVSLPTPLAAARGATGPASLLSTASANPRRSPLAPANARGATYSSTGRVFTSSVLDLSPPAYARAPTRYAYDGYYGGDHMFKSQSYPFSNTSTIDPGVYVSYAGQSIVRSATTSTDTTAAARIEQYTPSTASPATTQQAPTTSIQQQQQGEWRREKLTTVEIGTTNDEKTQEESSLSTSLDEMRSRWLMEQKTTVLVGPTQTVVFCPFKTLQLCLLSIGICGKVFVSKDNFPEGLSLSILHGVHEDTLDVPEEPAELPLGVFVCRLDCLSVLKVRLMHADNKDGELCIDVPRMIAQKIYEASGSVNIPIQSKPNSEINLKCTLTLTAQEPPQSGHSLQVLNTKKATPVVVPPPMKNETVSLEVRGVLINQNTQINTTAPQMGLRVFTSNESEPILELDVPKVKDTAASTFCASLRIPAPQNSELKFHVSSGALLGETTFDLTSLQDSGSSSAPLQLMSGSKVFGELLCTITLPRVAEDSRTVAVKSTGDCSASSQSLDGAPAAVASQEESSVTKFRESMKGVLGDIPSAHNRLKMAKVIQQIPTVATRGAMQPVLDEIKKAPLRRSITIGAQKLPFRKQFSKVLDQLTSSPPAARSLARSATTPFPQSTTTVEEDLGDDVLDPLSPSTVDRRSSHQVSDDDMLEPPSPRAMKRDSIGSSSAGTSYSDLPQDPPTPTMSAASKVKSSRKSTTRSSPSRGSVKVIPAIPRLSTTGGESSTEFHSPVGSSRKPSRRERSLSETEVLTSSVELSIVKVPVYRRQSHTGSRRLELEQEEDEDDGSAADEYYLKARLSKRRPPKASSPGPSGKTSTTGGDDSQQQGSGPDGDPLMLRKSDSNPSQQAPMGLTESDVELMRQGGKAPLPSMDSWADTNPTNSSQGSKGGAFNLTADIDAATPSSSNVKQEPRSRLDPMAGKKKPTTAPVLQASFGGNSFSASFNLKPKEGSVESGEEEEGNPDAFSANVQCLQPPTLSCLLGRAVGLAFGCA